MIRFACPNCKCVLALRDEHAGKIVVCPKCGQRMLAPQLPGTSSDEITRRRRRPLRAAIVWISVLLLAGGGGGIWLWTVALNREPAPIVALSPSSADKPPAVAIREQPSQSQSVPENRSAPVKDKPSQPFADARGSVEPPRQRNQPPVEKRREIDLSDDLPPELSFDLVDAVNIRRAKAGVGPIFLDVKASRACQSRAEQLARHISPFSPDENGEEFLAAEDPLTAVEKWLQEPKKRAVILGPRLRNFGAGFARNVDGRWFSVFDWTCGLDQGPFLSSSLVPTLSREGKGGAGVIVYPAPGQVRVPLWFPGNETPDPLPQTREKLSGYPITITFPPRLRIENVTAHLSNKEEGDVSIWLSSPMKPANPQFAGSQQNTICLIAQRPLHPNRRYQVEASATVDGAAWSAKWDFLTLSEGEIHQELAGTFVRLLNGLRRRAGLPPVPLDVERSQACAAHAHYLGRNAPNNPALNWNEEKPGLPGYTPEGAAAARTASIQGGGGPLEAAAGLIDSLISRPQVLDPHLHDLGLGYAPFALGGWIWVIDLHCASSHSLRNQEDTGRDNKEYFYPAPDQENVPLIYPPNEVPSPIPTRPRAERENEQELAGYAVTVLFGPRARVTAAAAKLVDGKGNEVGGWLSTPEKPAITGFSQHSLCFLPKAPLRPDTRYTATFQAEVNGKPWRRTWSFITLKEPDRYSDDLEEKVAARVNAARKSAGLPMVRLDAELSRGCQSHARYLARNYRSPEILGMGMHQQNADLPGASLEGAQAARESVIAVVLDPQTCVENWMATLYHRIPLLWPDLERIGFGHARIQGHKWVCVLDTGNGRAPRNKGR